MEQDPITVEYFVACLDCILNIKFNFIEFVTALYLSVGRACLAVYWVAFVVCVLCA